MNTCIDCGTRISSQARRCKPCANKRANNPNWRGGKDNEKYKDFNREIRNRIRYRDNFTCQICGAKQIMFGKKTGKLEVHHIDYNKEHTNPKNLVGLCKTCHIKTNYNREYWIKYFNDLFKKRGLL